MPGDWPVDGTVGYDFANLVNGIFIETRNRKSFTNLYQRFLSQWMDVETIIYQSKKLIMHTALSSEVNVLTHMLDEISSMNRRARDFTRSVLRDAIRETIACFPVYRTYLDERGNISERDRGYINEAIARAKRRNSSMPGTVFEFLRDILLLRGNDGGDAVIYGYRKQLYFALKFQQLTGPVMAKGLEDTACYVYNRFVSVNEVGGSPKKFGVELDEFHRANRSASAGVALLDADHFDARHEAQRGCANASRRALGDSAAMGGPGAALAPQQSRKKADPERRTHGSRCQRGIPALSNSGGHMATAGRARQEIPRGPRTARETAIGGPCPGHWTKSSARIIWRESWPT